MLGPFYTSSALFGMPPRVEVRSFFLVGKSGRQDENRANGHGPCCFDSVGLRGCRCSRGGSARDDVRRRYTWDDVRLTEHSSNQSMDCASGSGQESVRFKRHRPQVFFVDGPTISVQTCGPVHRSILQRIAEVDEAPT